MATTTPRPAPAPTPVVEGLPLVELRHLLDVHDADYIHCATDPDAQVPDSDWTPGGAA